MTRKEEFGKIFSASFREDPVWTRWMLENVYDDANLSTVEVDGRAVSVLLTSSRGLSYMGSLLRAAYLWCVATSPAERHKGYAAALLRDVLAAQAAAGYAVATLIPAESYLYDFYSRFGFSDVFLVDEQRYTSVHEFVMPDEYVPVEPVYDMFSALERGYDCAVLHDRRDFTQLMQSAEIDGSVAVAVSGPEGSCAMAFATADDSVHVRALHATDSVAAEAALALTRAETGPHPVIVDTFPQPGRRRLSRRGMLRILDVEAMLGALAASGREIKPQVIHVSDSLVEANNGWFRLSPGQVRRTSPERADLDVNVGVLASILFNDPAIGDIFGLPSVRPVMSLMLD